MELVNETPVVTIMKDLVKPIDIKETHISYVFITDEFVYKVKKSVDFGFLDFSTKKKRRAFCYLEQDLNKRFSDGIYLEIMKIARTKDGFAFVNYDNALLTVDYVVKMKRIDDKDFLSTRVLNDEINTDKIKEIGRQTAELFKNVESNEIQLEENGNYQTIKQNVMENFQMTEKYAGELIDKNIYEFIKSKSANFLEKHQDIFESRLADGFVIEGHGDLRLEHIYFDGDKIGLIDCIEFNRRFRYNDVVSEMSFLAMELDLMGRHDLTDALMEGFYSVYNDENTRFLLEFYKCYRAFVRIKVDCLFLAQKGKEWEGYEGKKAELDRLVDIALQAAINIEDIKTVVCYGLMGSGKSKNGKMLADKLIARYMNTDVERKIMFGYAVDEKVHDNFGEGLYSQENSHKLYKELGDRVRKDIKLSRMTIVDGSFSKPEYMEKFQNGGKIDVIKILFTAPDEIILERLNRRKDKSTASDGRVAIFHDQKSSFVDMGADLTVDTSGSPEENLVKILQHLMKSS